MIISSRAWCFPRDLLKTKAELKGEFKLELEAGHTSPNASQYPVPSGPQRLSCLASPTRENNRLSLAARNKKHPASLSK